MTVNSIAPNLITVKPSASLKENEYFLSTAAIVVEGDITGAAPWQCFAR